MQEIYACILVCFFRFNMEIKIKNQNAAWVAAKSSKILNPKNSETVFYFLIFGLTVFRTITAQK